VLLYHFYTSMVQKYYLFVTALIGNTHGYSQCDIRSRKNVTRTLKGTKSLHTFPGITLSDKTFLIVLNPGNLRFSYSKILLYTGQHSRHQIPVHQNSDRATVLSN